MKNLENARLLLARLESENISIVMGIDSLEMTSEGGPALSNFARYYNFLIDAGTELGFTEEEINRTAINLRRNAERKKNDNLSKDSQAAEPA